MYYLFGGDFYYPVGGWSDFIGKFSSEEEAKIEGYKRGFDWFEIVFNEKIIWKGSLRLE